MPSRTSYSSGYRTTTTDANKSRAHPCTEQNFTLQPGVIAAEIADDLEAALAQFSKIAERFAP